jgi:hypothetical protein
MGQREPIKVPGSCKHDHSAQEKVAEEMKDSVACGEVTQLYLHVTSPECLLRGDSLPEITTRHRYCLLAAYVPLQPSAT